jgi:hypothetical protein
MRLGSGYLIEVPVPVSAYCRVSGASIKVRFQRVLGVAMSDHLRDLVEAQGGKVNQYDAGHSPD